MTTTAISGTGVSVPPQTISNEELVASFNEYVRRYNTAKAEAIAAGEIEPLLESSDEFIVKASGIRHRRVVVKEGVLDPETMCPRAAERPNEELSLMAELAVAAARDAMKDAGRGAADIDGVIVSCSILQRPYPQIAIEVQDALGIAGFGFDMLAGCSSATFAMQTAVDMIAAGHARAILVISPEINTGHLNFRDRETHFIFGDAGAAMVIERADRAGGANAWEILSTKLVSQYSNNIRNNFGFLNRFAPEGIGQPDKLIVQRGRKVFQEVVPLAAEFMLKHLAENNMKPDMLKRLWLHQANIKMNELIAKKVLGRAAVNGEAPSILDRLGNTSSAGSIIAFHEFSRDLKAGDLGIICSFGAGYTVGSILVRKLR